MKPFYKKGTAMYTPFSVDALTLTKYLFYTGKGGVGKTSVACATAVTLADAGKKVLLISTDPASNLQDVFSTTLNGTATPIPSVPGLFVANIDPEQAAAEYRESVVGPYRGKLPDAVIANMEEQLSGSCTVEIAAFNEFTNFLANPDIAASYDVVVFDTAPTGHTLRMLQLPSAWTDFISEATHGASCLGQLSGLEEKKDTYKEAVNTLADGGKTTLMLVARPERAPLLEAERASRELQELGVNNQLLILNGLLDEAAATDDVSKRLYAKQQAALAAIPAGLQGFTTYTVPLRSYNVAGIESIRMMLQGDAVQTVDEKLQQASPPKLAALVDDIYTTGKRVVFTMGKGGVGKTTVAAAVALGLAEKGAKVHLTTTDPANHIGYVLDAHSGITTSYIDEAAELKKYQDEVIQQSIDAGMTGDDLEYIKEDLRSPCTQEIAVFRAFAEIVEMADNQIVIIDTAPTGHTLLLLDSTQSYHREVERTQGGNIPESVKRLLPRLRNKDETEVVIVTLPEPTPVFEAQRLEADLERAGIAVRWWVVNNSLLLTGTRSPVLLAKATSEVRWINEVNANTGGRYAVIPWMADEMQNDALLEMLGG